MNSDRTIVQLFKTAFVICTILTFGVILNSVAKKKDKIIAERDHQTLVRISLVREEYERKMADMKMIYEQKVQQVMNLMKKSATEELEKQKNELEEKFAKELKNQSEEIENIRLQLKRIADQELNQELNQQQNQEEKSLSSLEKIQQLLSKIKSQILHREKELKTDKNEKYSYVEDKELPKQITNQLDRRKIDSEK
ncbi:uncharacterized protein LOC120342853 [Styela clava]